MKYEEIEVGESYKISYHTEEVIAKSDNHRAVLTTDEFGTVWGWSEDELELFQPIKKQLPETGLLVCNNGFIAYRLEGSKGFGFNKKNHFHSKEYFSFISDPEHWRTATPEEQAKFIKLLKAEAERRGLGVDAKIKRHADGGPLFNPDCMEVRPRFKLDTAYNKNGQIFHNGTWAEPLTMLDEVTEVIKKHLPNVVVEMTDGVVTLKQL